MSAGVTAGRPQHDLTTDGDSPRKVSEDLNKLNSEPGSLDLIEVLMIFSQTDSRTRARLLQTVTKCVEFRGCSGHWPLTVMRHDVTVGV